MLPTDALTLERRAQLHELAADRFEVLGEDARAERERRTAATLRSGSICIASHPASRTVIEP